MPHVGVLANMLQMPATSSKLKTFYKSQPGASFPVRHHLLDHSCSRDPLSKS